MVEFALEQVHRRTVDVPVPQVLEETIEVVRLAPRERVQQRTVVPMPQVLEETVKVVRLAPHERGQQRTAEHSADVLQCAEETIEVVRFAPRERVQQRTAEQIEDAPQEHVEWIDEQKVEVPIPQMSEEIGEEIVDKEFQRRYFDTFPDKEACLTKMDELTTQLDERFKKSDALRIQKIKDLGQIRRSRCGEWWVRSVSPF